MTDRTKLSKLRLTLITAALASGLVSVANTGLAEDSNVSEKDMLAQAVALYEKLSGEAVAVPDALVDECGSSELAKAVILGFKNADEAGSVSDAVTIRKQDALTVLYKTVISYDYSYALNSEEIDELMNTCYDNALVDEENRAAYAFMLKHKIIDNGFDTEPNKLITWDSCRTLVDVLYDLFVQNVSVSVGDCSISVGSNVSSVAEALGEPLRIDKSDYDFDWYVYNSDKSGFLMLGVKEDRICAFFTNTSGFKFGDLQEGDDYLLAYKYLDNSDFRIFENNDGKIDAVMYNPYTKSDVTLENDGYLRSCELVDMINSTRAKSGFDELNIDRDLYSSVKSMVTQPKYQELARDLRFAHTMDDARHEQGYDIFLIYQKLLQSNSDCFSESTKSIGIATYADESLNIYASIKCSDKASELTTETADIETVSPDTIVFQTLDSVDSDNTQESYIFESAANDTTAETPFSSDTAAETLNSLDIKAPLNEAVIPADSDVTIELSDAVADEYYVSVYSIEEDKYIVNSYFKTDSSSIVLTRDLFTPGMDYTVSVSAVSDSASGNVVERTIRYGEVPEKAVTLSIPEIVTTDNDFLDLAWESELYSNFVIDAYDVDGKLVLSETVSDTQSVTINSIDPGTYYIYVTALRNGTEDVFKSQAMTTVEVVLPEPVITEYILDEDEKFYPIYEDPEMGLLYFYDEEIIDVETTSPSGKATTVKRKKITEKQVKDVAYYRSLAAARDQVEYFIGSGTLNSSMTGDRLFSYNGSQMSIYNATIGDAAVEEAKKFLGVPYLWGGTTPSGFDCSGLVQYVYRSLGININRVSQDQYKQGAHISREDLMPGDLVFFEKNGDVHHVGMYVGDGYMIHAPYTGAVVSYQSIDTPYYKSQFCGGRRVY